MKTKWKKNKKMAITLSGVIFLLIALLGTMLFNRQIVFAQESLIPTRISPTWASASRIFRRRGLSAKRPFIT